MTNTQYKTIKRLILAPIAIVLFPITILVVFIAFVLSPDWDDFKSTFGYD